MQENRLKAHRQNAWEDSEMIRARIQESLMRTAARVIETIKPPEWPLIEREDSQSSL